MSRIFNVFRDFKRHYHKIKTAFNLIKDVSFQIIIVSENNAITTQNSTPNLEATTQFVVLMRRLLNPNDKIFYQKVFQDLRDNSPEGSFKRDFDQISYLVENLNKSSISIEINGESFLPATIYQTISDGNYFDEVKEVKDRLEKIQSSPIVGSLFWHEFYSYNLSAFRLASKLFDVVLEIEKLVPSLKQNSEPSFRNRCIYCLTMDGTFKSEEHIFPESLGNDQLILPKGYVCDKCNNGILARLDDSLLKFGPIAQLQILYVPYTKSGKLPHADLGSFNMNKVRPRELEIIAKDESKNPITNEQVLKDGSVTFTLHSEVGFEPKPLARSLYKIALGIAAIQQGQEHVCDPRFNQARAFINEGGHFPNNLLMSMQCVPSSISGASYYELNPGTVFEINIYGWAFMVNLESFPKLELNEMLKQLNVSVHSLEE